MAEGAPLLREYVCKTCIEGSNPSGSAKDRGTTGSTPHFIVPDLQPAEALFDELYQRLRVLARSHLRRNEPIMLLDTTGLVHE